MFRFLISFAVFWMFCAPAMAQGPIRVVIDEWPPFGGADLPDGGFTMDVTTSVLRRAGYEVEEHIVPFERALAGMESGEFDVLGHVFREPTMDQLVAYTDAFHETEIRFMAQPNLEFTFQELSNLEPYTIAVGAGYLYEPAFDAADHLQKQEVTTTLQAMQMVAKGRVDLSLDSVEVIEYLLRNEAQALRGQIVLKDNSLARREILTGIRKNLPNRDAILAAYNAALAEMRADGTLERINARHLE